MYSSVVHMHITCIHLYMCIQLPLVHRCVYRLTSHLYLVILCTFNGQNWGKKTLDE